MALPTVADLKAHINLPTNDTSQDDELEQMLDAAIEVVENSAGPLSAGTVTETHYDVNSDMLLLRQTPTSALASVSLRSYGSDVEQTLSDYDLDVAAGIVRVGSGARFYGTYVVEYQTGRVEVPASLRLAILIIAAHLFETQRVPGASRFAAPEAVVPAGYAIPNRALELMAPYRTSLGIA